MKREKHLGTYLAFLCALVIFLGGVDRVIAPARGGTLARGGGTLPLKLPLDGVLSLGMVGEAEAEQELKAAISLDLELTPTVTGKADLESLMTITDLSLRQRRVCLDILGPMWKDEIGSGRLVIADEAFDVTNVCSHEVSGEVALMISQLREGEDAASCFVTGLRATEDLAFVSGELSCSIAIFGSSSLKFKLGSE